MSPVASPAVTGRRRSNRVRVSAPATPVVRCALYCRLSVSDGNENGFSSIVSQREACEAFVSSQRESGWVLVSERFEDDGYSGGTIERPALRRLLTAIDAGDIDCVVVHKIDRLSRSLLDFVRLLEIFEAKGVSFAAVSQQISTTSSAGRLMLNVLMSFAQFEREIISERTSDKMCAARRKGKWLGGPPILGYDLDRERHRLLVNPDEAEMVREVFDLYIQNQSALKVAEELNRRGWMTKSWTRKNGKAVEPTRWDKAKVLRLLANPTYTGKVLHKGELYDGEHEGIIDEHVFEQAQSIVTLNGHGNGPATRNQHGALLKGLIRCGACGAAMAHTYTKKGDRLYRYYACSTRQKQGRGACNTPSLPAQDVEDFVVEQIKKIGKNPKLVEQVYAEVVRQQKEQVPRLEAELAKLSRARQKKAEEVRRLVGVLASSETPLPSVSEHLQAVEEVLARLEGRLAELKRSLAALRTQTIDAEHLRQTLERFEPLWDVFQYPERVGLVRQAVTSATYDPTTGEVSLILCYL